MPAAGSPPNRKTVTEARSVRTRLIHRPRTFPLPKAERREPQAPGYVHPGLNASAITSTSDTPSPATTDTTSNRQGGVSSR